MKDAEKKLTLSMMVQIEGYICIKEMQESLSLFQMKVLI